MCESPVNAILTKRTNLSNVGIALHRIDNWKGISNSHVLQPLFNVPHIGSQDAAIRIGNIESHQKLPGTEVPRATKAMALTESLRKMKQPKWPATSPMTAVVSPIIAMDTTNVA